MNSPSTESEGLWLSPPVVSTENAAPVLRIVLSRPAGELLLQQTEPSALPPRLDAVHLLVVEPLQEASDHSLESPAALSLAEIVKLALFHPTEAELLKEVHPGVRL